MLVVLLVLPRVIPKIPAVLVAVAGATIVSAVFDLAAHGVATVGTLPQGFPKPSLPWTSFDDVGPLLLAAVGIVLVSLTDTIATASAFAARRGDELEPNQEMIGMGAANVAAGFFQGFAVSTSGSRTAVAEQSGAKSQLTGVVGAGLVVVLLLFLNSLLADLPQSALAGGRHRRRALAHEPRRAAPVLGGAAVVAPAVARRDARASSLFGVLEGIVVAIFLAVLLFFRRNWWPHGAVLGRTDDSEGWHGVDDLPRRARGARHRRVPLGGAAVLRQRGRVPPGRSARSCEARQPRWIVLQCEAITDIDVTAAEMLEQLDVELNAPASTWRSSRCAAASRTWSASTASTTRSTATTSTPPSTPRSPPSSTRRRARMPARREPCYEHGVDKIWANSGDSHLVEPADLFTSSLPPALAERMPRSEVDDDRQWETIHVDGQSFRRRFPLGRLMVDSNGQTVMERAPGANDPALRLLDLDDEGVWGELIYPSIGIWTASIRRPRPARRRLRGDQRLGDRVPAPLTALRVHRDRSRC